MNSISKNAVVSPKAKIGDNITIKDFAVIEDDVILKDNIVIGTNALICNGTRMSSNNQVYHSAVLGSTPQDLKFKGEFTTLEIGENNVFREFVTISRGTTDRNKTVIGNNCFLMAYVHVPHDSVIGDDVNGLQSRRVGPATGLIHVPQQHVCLLGLQARHAKQRFVELAGVPISFGVESVCVPIGLRP